MANTFHLAIPAGDLERAKTFYCDVLGCRTGNSEEGHWVDIDFWGNELTLHQTETQIEREPHPTDMKMVCVPHFGVHLSKEDFEGVKTRIESSSFEYLTAPYTRFAGTQFELETFFIEDPNNNVMEIKTMRSPELLFEPPPAA